MKGAAAPSQNGLLPVGKLADEKKSHPKVAFFHIWRREPESNRPTRLCRPLHNRFAIAPEADCRFVMLACARSDQTDFVDGTP